MPTSRYARRACGGSAGAIVSSISSLPSGASGSGTTTPSMRSAGRLRIEQRGAEDQAKDRRKGHDHRGESPPFHVVAAAQQPGAPRQPPLRGEEQPEDELVAEIERAGLRPVPGEDRRRERQQR